MDKKKLINDLAMNVVNELKKQDIQKITQKKDIKVAAIEIGRNILVNGISKSLGIDSIAKEEDEEDITRHDNTVEMESEELVEEDYEGGEEPEETEEDSEGGQKEANPNDSLSQEPIMMAPVTGPAAAVAALAIVAKSANEAIKYTEAEETKREEIRAERDIALANISSMKDFLMEYLDKSFDERKTNFSRLFDTVDIAIEKGDVNALSLALNSINELAASSPFKALSDMGQVKQLLADKDTELDI